ncbi:hypothetical protein CWB99_12110 [Pseudoalteromonas rubra]|uniref:Uncharacterized protein n=1 Tax=Pseudoalteromonas rubra TaxID=43658 RepID=A0A5S3WQ26_9GAMM|nr:hypothetical protein [Pseudoalteromonas rubra]TMP28283.1 hypothetical protein CWC00_21655 [Pseudoalteromonas rubra]TMP28331.1 hypothetical protein CWB99_12110 [Pseudoalteromonas rubra]TMP29772.1 hypothetical protein CWB98_23450 [Pseudoalteromonas rubra]
MLRTIALNLGLLVSFVTQASAPIESVKLEQTLASELGFIIELSRDKEATNLSVEGPKELNGCAPLKVGTAILNKENLDIALSISEVTKGATPKSFGYIRNVTDNKLLIFIDYICPVGRRHQSRRYELWSSST